MVDLEENYLDLVLEAINNINQAKNPAKVLAIFKDLTDIGLISWTRVCNGGARTEVTASDLENYISITLSKENGRYASAIKLEFHYLSEAVIKNKFMKLEIIPGDFKSWPQVIVWQKALKHFNEFVYLASKIKES